MRLRLYIFMACSWAPLLAYAEEFPTTWIEFKYSTNPQNKQAAASVEAELKKSSRRACIEWGRGLRKTTETRIHAARSALLQSTDSINGLDIGHARERRITIGMTACGVFAALGEPDDINTTERANSYHAQIVYRARPTYIYVEMNRKTGQMLVTSIQR